MFSLRVGLAHKGTTKMSGGKLKKKCMLFCIIYMHYVGIVWDHHMLAIVDFLFVSADDEESTTDETKDTCGRAFLGGSATT